MRRSEPFQRPGQHREDGPGWRPSEPRPGRALQLPLSCGAQDTIAQAGPQGQCGTLHERRDGAVVVPDAPPWQGAFAQSAKT